MDDRATLWTVISEPTLRSYTFPAIGTTATLVITDPTVGEAAHGMLRSELDILDRTCSRFRHDSELYRLNTTAGEHTDISQVLQEYLTAALDVARETDGAVDPTIGSAMVANGYDRSFDQLSGRRAPVRAHRVPAGGWRHVRVADRTVVRPSSVVLDLGATAKAHAADRAAQSIAEHLGCGALVSLGGDISVAGGAPDGGWPVGIADDHRDVTGAAQVVALSSGGLATSSTTVRQWPTHTGRAHHIVIPATGVAAPVVWRTVSVAARTCLSANAASTAAIVKGARAERWLRERGHCARLVALDGTVVTTGDWPTA